MIKIAALWNALRVTRGRMIVRLDSRCVCLGQAPVVCAGYNMIQQHLEKKTKRCEYSMPIFQQGPQGESCHPKSKMLCTCTRKDMDVFKFLLTDSWTILEQGFGTSAKSRAVNVGPNFSLLVHILLVLLFFLCISLLSLHSWFLSKSCPAIDYRPAPPFCAPSCARCSI